MTCLIIIIDCWNITLAVQLSNLIDDINCSEFLLKS